MKVPTYRGGQRNLPHLKAIEVDISTAARRTQPRPAHSLKLKIALLTKALLGSLRTTLFIYLHRTLRKLKSFQHRAISGSTFLNLPCLSKKLFGAGLLSVPSSTSLARSSLARFENRFRNATGHSRPDL
jgi:hypothetical protein